MKFNLLGNSLRVPEICLGTMTFGEQNSEAEGHAQLDFALECGINFIDTAEMYAVPSRAETFGATETIIGAWLKKKPRDKVIVATKVAGPSRNMTWIRGGPLSMDRSNIREAIEGSLKRLQTDYVDLYQLHWPERNVPMFGQYSFDAAKEREGVTIRAQLETLAELVQEGKVRHIGLSNETPWGVCEFARAAQASGLPRMVSIQNAYNLLNRVFEYGLSEVSYREKIGLLAYSPLAFGHLSGKYLDNPQARGRITLWQGFGQRYSKVNTLPAVRAYAELARKLGMSLATLALAFIRSRGFAASTIIGATTMGQLKENIAAFEVELNEDALREIELIHLRYTNPAP